MTENHLFEDVALELVQSSDLFPVDFDDAWKWIGYVAKQKAKDKLLRHFEIEVDYKVIQTGKLVSRPDRGEVEVEDIRLSTDCFKQLAMMAGTKQGRSIRHYFLECERIAKTKTLGQPIEKLPPEPEIPMLSSSMASERVRIALDAFAVMKEVYQQLAMSDNYKDYSDIIANQMRRGFDGEVTLHQRWIKENKSLFSPQIPTLYGYRCKDNRGYGIGLANAWRTAHGTDPKQELYDYGNNTEPVALNCYPCADPVVVTFTHDYFLGSSRIAA